MSVKKFKSKSKTNTCKNKQGRWKNKERACWRARQLEEETGVKWRAYQCEAGRHYHLTTH